MHRSFSVVVTALVSPMSAAPRGYGPPNGLVILVAHICGAFPYVPGTVVALTSIVMGIIFMPVLWMGKPRHGWVLAKVISPACGVCDGSVSVPFTAPRLSLRPVRGLGGYYLKRLCGDPAHLGLLRGLHSGVDLGLHALLVLLQLGHHPLQVLHVLDYFLCILEAAAALCRAAASGSHHSCSSSASLLQFCSARGGAEAGLVGGWHRPP